MLAEMEATVGLSQWLSICFPSTFYLSVTNELSSRGYDNMLAFYKYVLIKKREFVKYILEKVYFSNFTRVIPFFSGDEENSNIYYARSGLPGNYIYGVLMLLLLIVVLNLFSYAGFKKDLYREPEYETFQSENRPIEMGHGQYKVIRVQGDDFNRRLYNLFSGHHSAKTTKNLANQLIINQQDIVTLTEKQDFLYICPQSALPEDIKIFDLSRFIKQISIIKLKTNHLNIDIKKETEKIKTLKLPDSLAPLKGKTMEELKADKKSLLLLHIMDIMKTHIYLINDITRDMPVNILTGLKERMDDLSGEGRNVIFLTSTSADPQESPDDQSFRENRIWAILAKTNCQNPRFNILFSPFAFTNPKK
jgi:hypothetical protein